MIHITRTKKGFAVKSVADNGELLQSSETLNSKASCWKNIKAMGIFYGTYKGGSVGKYIKVQDDTTKKLTCYRVYMSYKTKMEVFVMKPNPPYIAGKNPKHKSTKK